jgi:hypothetical protein
MGWCGGAPELCCGEGHKGERRRNEKRRRGVVEAEGGISPGKARVYVIEIVGTNDTGVTTRVGVDGNWVGANTGKGYISFEVDPGDHNICADWQSILKARQQDGGAMVMKAEEGRTYYFVVGVLVQALDFNLTEVDEAEGQWLLSISQKSVWTQKKK